MKKKLQKLGNGIYPRHQTYWLAFTPFSGQRQKHISLHTADPDKAKVKAAAYRKNPHLATCGTWQDEIKALRQYATEYGSHSPYTLQNYEYALGLFFQIVTVPIPQVNDVEIRKFFDRIKVKGFSQRNPTVIPSSSTQLSYWTRLQGFFGWLLLQNKIRENYFVGPQEWPEHHRQRLKPGQWIETKDIRILFSAVRPDGKKIKLEPEVEFVLHCGFHVGMRKNEITHAKPDWFDAPRQLIKIPGRDKTVPEIPFKSKTGQDRIAPFSKEFRKFMASKRGRFMRGNKFCLANTSQGGRYRYDFRYKFKKYIREMGYPHLTAHGMRHSFVTACLQANKTLTKVASYIGDREATVEEVYSHLIPRKGELDGVF